MPVINCRPRFLLGRFDQCGATILSKRRRALILDG